MGASTLLPFFFCAALAASATGARGAPPSPGKSQASKKAPRPAQPLALGGYHTCALLDSDAVKCWGYNAKGMLGLGDTEDRGDAPGELGNALPTVDLGKGRTVQRPW